ncbi:hypothetical protein ACQPZ2_21975 [Nocardia pseudovaccinii]|uniref:hypothetical protein n=1 Tax=Nocardia pseudovaccinii TaxID=189540 RepID=UPI003D8A2662
MSNHERTIIRAAIIAAATVTAAAGAGVLLAPSASASMSDTPDVPPALVSDCGGPHAVEPPSLTLTCADGNNMIIDITWQLWSGAHAVGYGTQHRNDCTPSCAAGRFIDSPAVLMLDDPRPFADAPGNYFARVTVFGAQGVHSYPTE